MNFKIFSPEIFYDNFDKFIFRIFWVRRLLFYSLSKDNPEIFADEEKEGVLQRLEQLIDAKISKIEVSTKFDEISLKICRYRQCTRQSL